MDKNYMGDDPVTGNDPLHDTSFADFDIIKNMLFSSIEEANNGESFSTKSTDYLSILNARINFMISQNETDSELVNSLNTERESIYQEVIGRTFLEPFDFDPEFEVEGYTLSSFSEAVYNFFVVNRIERYTDYFVEAIINNQKLFKPLKAEIDKSEVDVYTIRKYISNYNHVVIIIKIKEIVDMILGESTNAPFVSSGFTYATLSTEGELFTSIIESFNEDFPIANFAELFLKPLTKNKVLKDIVTSEVNKRLLAHFKTTGA